MTKKPPKPPRGGEYRNYISDAARRYLRTRMGITAPVLEDQEANQLWRHLYQFGRRMVRADRRRR